MFTLPKDADKLCLLKICEIVAFFEGNVERPPIFADGKGVFKAVFWK